MTLHKARAERHGMTLSPEYNAWNQMIARCERPSNRSYKWYGALGIRVCDEWRESFVKFYEHVGPRPSKNHSLDRIDSARGYEPGNVRWATPLQQTLNQRMNARNTSGYRGVHKVVLKSGTKWNATVMVDKQKIHIGRFQHIEEAAYMRDQFALALWGAEAKLNVLDPAYA